MLNSALGAARRSAAPALFEAFLKAALRLDRLELRAWLRRRLKNPPFAVFDPALTFGDADIALVLRRRTKLVPPPTGDDAYENEAYRLLAIKQQRR